MVKPSFVISLCHSCAVPQQEDRAQQNGEPPPRAERGHRTLHQRAFCHPDGETAGEQKDRIQDRQLQHLSRLRAIRALADVIDVGHDEDREDRRLRSESEENMPTRPRDGSFQSGSLPWACVACGCAMVLMMAAYCCVRSFFLG